jgi:type I restriction enzyme S subunit
MAIRPLGGLSEEYLAICIDSSERFFQQKKFGIAIPGIGRDEVLNLQIILPSSEEQKRIIERVHGLLRICNVLEQKLEDAKRVAERLVGAAASALTGIVFKQEEDEPVKAPQTELISPLRLGIPPDLKALAPLATLLSHQNGEMAAHDLWQRFGGEIDAFYAELKAEVAQGWIQEPVMGMVREVSNEAIGT